MLRNLSVLYALSELLFITIFIIHALTFKLSFTKQYYNINKNLDLRIP